MSDKDIETIDDEPQLENAPSDIDNKPEVTEPVTNQTPQDATESTSATPEAGIATEAPVEASPVSSPAVPTNETTEDTSSVSPQNVVDITGNLPPAQDAMQRTAQNYAFANDLQNGKIQPKKYQDLFHDKSTLGKIGTLFGLLVSGAGSGLSHQPNAVLEMMNKEIERDLEAQKTNQTNKQNWYNAAMQHEKNLVDINQVNAATQGIQAGTFNKNLESEMLQYTNNQLPGFIDTSASTEAKNNMLSAALHDEQSRVDRMAPGPSKIHAQALIDNYMRPGVNRQIAENNLLVAQKKAAILQMQSRFPNEQNASSSDPRGPVMNEEKFQKGRALGLLTTKSPYAIPPPAVERINDEAKIVEQNRNNYADWLDSFKELEKLKFAGQVPAAGAASSLLTGAGSLVGGVLAGPLGLAGGAGFGHIASNSIKDLQNTWERNRAIQIESFKQRLGKDLSTEDKDNLVKSLFPAWNDSDKSRSEAFRKGVQHFQSLDNSLGRTMRTYDLKKPFPMINYESIKKIEPQKKEEVEPAGSKTTSSRTMTTTTKKEK